MTTVALLAADSPSFGTLNYTILIVYMTAIVAIGCLFAGKQKTTDEYFLAGRNMPWLVVGMSMFASLTSAISYLGIPGTAYKENVSLLVMALISPIVAPFLIIVFYPFYRALHVTTSYEYVRHRFGQPAQFMVSLLFLFARLGWLGAVLYAPALTLSVVTGINLSVAILLMGVLATAYTVLGGLSAVLWTDLVQFVILVAGAVWVAISLCVSVPGGVAGIFQIAHETDHLRVVDWQFSLVEMTGIAVGVSYFFQLMQDYGTDQVTVQRLMAVKTFRGMAKAVIFNSLCDLVMVSLLLFLGLGLLAYYHSFPEALADGVSGDRVLPHYIIHSLPAGVSGLLITAIFAAAMSSMDSGINSMSTVLVSDFVKPLRSTQRTQQDDVTLARLLTLALGMTATIVAFYVSGFDQILKASSAFLALFGAPILALFLLGMLTRRANFLGWLAGVGVAIPATIWLQHGTWLQNDEQVHFIYYFPFCFAVSGGVGYAVGVLISIFGNGSLADRKLTIWGREWPS